MLICSVVTPPLTLPQRPPVVLVKDYITFYLFNQHGPVPDHQGALCEWKGFHPFCYKSNHENGNYREEKQEKWCFKSDVVLPSNDNNTKKQLHPDHGCHQLTKTFKADNNRSPQQAFFFFFFQSQTLKRLRSQLQNPIWDL